MSHGLSDRTLETLRRVLALYPEVEGAVLYGSRAKGTHEPGSDIDLALLGERVDSRTCGHVWSDLDDSDIPYTVDVSAFALLKDEALIEHVRRVGVVIYARDTEHPDGPPPAGMPRGR